MDYREALLTHTTRLAERYAAADPAAPVPTCPGWTVRDLATHVGRGHRWAATIVETRSDGPADLRTVSDGRQPDDPAEGAAWVTAGAQRVVEAVEAAGADPDEAPVWTFTGPKPASWWLRRRLHEATVHGADLALALGQPVDLEPDVAADGLAEWLDLLAARPAEAGLTLAPGESLHLHAHDEGLDERGEWVVRGTPEGVDWEPGHAKATVAVRGSARDLLLGALRRTDSGLDVVGDPQVWRTWLERTGF